jgi:hypothetical protein
MKVKTWNNGNFNKSGAGYGIRIKKKDRDYYFDRTWDCVFVHIEENMVVIKLADTFWTTCNELRNKEIGKYLMKHGLSKWNKGLPYELELEIVNKNELRLSGGEL